MTPNQLLQLTLGRSLVLLPQELRSHASAAEHRCYTANRIKKRVAAIISPEALLFDESSGYAESIEGCGLRWRAEGAIVS